MISDARARYTKMVIKKCFIEILKRQPLNRITVKEVCESAEINRATFYKHYTDCFDLLKQIEDDSIAELQQLLQESHYKNNAEMFKKIFSRIKENSDLYTTIVSENGDTTFPNRILNLCYEQTNLSIENNYPNISKLERDWLFYFSANGCSGVLGCWISTGMEEDISEVSEFLSDLLNKLSK